MKLIIITGTPGTGKSTLARFLAKKLGWKRLDLHRYYSQISTGYNRKKQCYNINYPKFLKLVEQEIKEHPQEKFVLDSHISHRLPGKLVKLCVILVCSDLKLLEKRLKKRKYSLQKIKENLEAEIFQVCLSEAKERKHRLLVIDVGKEKTLSQQWFKISKSWS